MAELSFEIEDNLLEDLKVRAITIESSFEDLIVKYIEQGLKGRDFMSTVNLEENVMEKVNIKSDFQIKLPMRLLMMFCGKISLNLKMYPILMRKKF